MPTSYDRRLAVLKQGRYRAATPRVRIIHTIISNAGRSSFTGMVIGSIGPFQGLLDPR
jgi:hypothetical protein